MHGAYATGYVEGTYTMATTPEGKIKKQVKDILKHFDVWFDMPVPGGFGKSQLDFTCCVRGRMLAIETKAPGKWLTALQCKTAADMYASGAKVFFISEPSGVMALYRYLNGIPWNTPLNL